jgi:hypothetical protein
MKNEVDGFFPFLFSWRGFTLPLLQQESYPVSHDITLGQSRYGWS